MGKKKYFRNRTALKKGSYSVAITTIVLAILIAVNVFVGFLGDKVNLEFDMSKSKASTLSDENKAYLEKIDEDILITVCADKETYSSMMDSYAEQSSIYGGADYYSQTITLIEKYSKENDKIKIKFVDTEDSAFAKVTASYPKEDINYGDIIVSLSKNEGRYQKLNYYDIYNLDYNEEYANYGYTAYDVTGSNLETKLTGAIEYVITGKTLNIAVLSGHSKTDYTESYVALLKQNNYKVSVVDSALISSIDKTYDAVVIAAPSVDFTPEEIKAISDFLNNDGELSKGLIYFADATVPTLPNLNAFLKEWGIKQGEGILFETNADNYMPEMPTSMGLYPDEEDKITENMKIFCTGSNAPLEIGKFDEEKLSVISLISTTDSVVKAPIGTSDSWKGYKDYKKGSFQGLIQSSKTKDSKTSFVFAFSSVEFIYSDWAQYDSFSNLDIALAVSERAGGVDESAISFVTKTIDNWDLAGSVTQSSAVTIRVIFVFLLPILMVGIGIYVYIKRKNA